MHSPGRQGRSEMTSSDYYLRLPQPYVGRLGGLRWSDTEDAIEFEDGRHFVFKPELALFLQGFGSERSLIPFFYILHLLGILVEGDAGIRSQAERADEARLESNMQDDDAGTPRVDVDVLHRAYCQGGRLPRNAGVLCGMLCKDIPAAPGDISVDDLVHRLTRNNPVTLHAASGSARTATFLLVEPATFLDSVRNHLRDYSPAELEHWMRHGRAPLSEEGKRLSEIVRPPQTLGSILTTLIQAPRLATGLPFLPQLVSALSIPPRRLERSELAIGGYADIATRGRPEQLLPGQFALDKDEFTRRFAENELLYFRREEPPAGQREELVLLLDQGVRTWGIVRTLLGAAALALIKLADRKKRALSVAGTSNGGVSVDPLSADPEELAKLVAASDLSVNPGLALETVLLDLDSRPRDIVLLTHPRNLLEFDVTAAALRLPSNCRLFGVIATAEGEVEFVEIARGAQRLLAKIRVDLEQKKSARREPRSQGVERDARLYRPWTGDVERFAFPFWFGLIGSGNLFDFDHDGHWIFIEGDRRIIHAARTDGTWNEILPRPLIHDSVQVNWRRLLGVVGGFCLAGIDSVAKRVLLTHYDIVRRHARIFMFDSAVVGETQTWTYDSARHIIRLSASAFFDLTEGTFRSMKAKEPHLNVADKPRKTQLAKHYSQVIPVSKPGSGDPNISCDLAFDRVSGMLELLDPDGEAKFSVQPLGDGEPILAGAVLNWAALRANTLAIAYTVSRIKSGGAILLILVPEGRVLGSFDAMWSDAAVLSNDGSKLAHWERGSPTVFAVHDVMNAGRPLLSLNRGRYHNQLWYGLKPTELAVSTGGTFHRIEWSSGVLRVESKPRPTVDRRDSSENLAIPIRGVPRDRLLGGNRERPYVSFQLKTRNTRFVSSAESTLIAAADPFGHILLFDSPDELLCIFFFFRATIGAWIPDGTQWGPPNLLDGAPTPNALEKIGSRLLEASRRVEDSPL
jgi:MoxR-vWA-beta-propeller ternary system domain bpX1